ncbi:MAG TPA: tetratricopeptide repeat protein, partial [Rhodanobacteraceae bacterium]|nr:tetratricopeptide repeat protein [Rhodanobacteraceae bacterium]
LQWRRAESNAAEARSSAARADTARQLLAGVFEQADADQNKGRPLTPHQLLENGEKLLAGESSADAATRADLTGMVGTLYWNIGDYARAETLLKEADRISASDDVPPVVKARNQLALAKAAQEKNQYDIAIATATRARELAAAAGDDGHREASDAVRFIADAKIGNGDTKEAEPMLRKALADDRARFGADSAAVATDMALLATALLELSRMDEAIAMSTAAIEAQTKIHGRNNSEVTYSMGTLAVALRNTGRYADAERVLREAIAIEETMYAPDHRELLTARSNLLIVVEAQGRFEEALQGREALLDAQKKLAANRPDVLAYAYKNIAADLLGLGRFADAEKTARQALDQWKAIQGADNEWHSVAARDMLATALQYQGRYDEAEAVWRETLAIQRRREPATSIWLNATRGNLGGLLRLRHANADAVDELRAALADLATSATPVRANLLAQLAEAELDAGHATEAREAATKAVAIARDVLPAKNFKLGAPLFALARVELADGRADRAEALLREALAVRSPPYGAEDPRVLEVKVSLVLALRALHHDDEARAIQAPVDAALAVQKTAYAIDLGKRLHQPAT